MQKIAEAAIEAAPNKKIQGNYYKSWYRYPNLRVDLITRTYFTWQNYTGNVATSYDNAIIGEFHWNPQIDDEI
ncbi:hypothetical protein D3C71_2159510 [compost metagenome]